MMYKHMDEAWGDAKSTMRQWIKEFDVVDRAVLAVDLFGRVRAIIWCNKNEFDSLEADLRQKLGDAAERWWSDDLWLTDIGKEDPVHTLAWKEAVSDVTHPKRLRLLERHRNRGAWFTDLQEPVWQPRGAENPEGPPVVVFYSFKGGLGRSTALAAFAIQRARLGERVAVLDFDLDAPGVGVLLAADAEGRTSPWGTLDYLLERQDPGELQDYYHSCRRLEVIGEVVSDNDKRELIVFPAGKLDSIYASKLARVDLEPQPGAGENALASMLLRIRDELRPDWILLDARTGLSEPAGALLSGIAHLHVLFGTPSEQSWQGLRVIVERLGVRRITEGLPQGDCLLVQAMVPPDTETARKAHEVFEQRARDEFSNTEYGYYAEASDDDWDLADMDTPDAPHLPIPITYDLRLAHFKDVADVADLLAESRDYRQLTDRIIARFEEARDE